MFHKNIACMYYDFKCDSKYKQTVRNLQNFSMRASIRDNICLFSVCYYVCVSVPSLRHYSRHCKTPLIVIVCAPTLLFLWKLYSLSVNLCWISVTYMRMQFALVFMFRYSLTGRVLTPLVDDQEGVTLRVIKSMYYSGFVSEALL